MISRTCRAWSALAFEMRHECQQVHRLQVWADRGFLEEVHSLLEGVWAESADVSETDQMMFSTAVIEVAANIIEHGSHEATVRCDLTIEVYADHLEARFRDDGTKAMVDLDTAAMPNPLAEAGRGLAMAKAALDVLSYERRNNANVWILSRTRTAG